MYISNKTRATLLNLPGSNVQNRSMWNDDEILKGCIKKDPRAQKLLYEKYCRGLMGVCLRFTGNRDEAEDVLQEGFVKIFMNIESFKEKSSLGAWMRRIIINTAITLYHRNLKHRHHYDVDDFREKTIADAAWDGAEYTRDELYNIIKDIPAGYRIVFNLYAVEGFKHKEIARKLNIDINTSKSQYSRAKTYIQGKLEELGREKKRDDVTNVTNVTDVTRVTTQTKRSGNKGMTV